MRAWTSVKTIAAVVGLALLVVMVSVERAGAQGVVETPCGAAREISVDGPSFVLDNDPTGNDLSFAATLEPGVVYSIGVMPGADVAIGWVRFSIVQPDCTRVRAQTTSLFGPAPAEDLALGSSSRRFYFTARQRGRHVFVFPQQYPTLYHAFYSPVPMSLASEPQLRGAIPLSDAEGPELIPGAPERAATLWTSYQVDPYRVFVPGGQSVGIELRLSGGAEITDSIGATVYRLDAPPAHPMYVTTLGDVGWCTSDPTARDRQCQTLYSPVDAWYVIRVGYSNPWAWHEQNPLAYELRVTAGPSRPATLPSATREMPAVLSDVPVRLWSDVVGGELWLAVDMIPGRLYQVQQRISLGDWRSYDVDGLPRAEVVAQLNQVLWGGYWVSAPTRVLFRAQLSERFADYSVYSTSFVADEGYATPATALRLVPGAAPMALPAVNSPLSRWLVATIPARSLMSVRIVSSSSGSVVRNRWPGLWNASVISDDSNGWYFRNETKTYTSANIGTTPAELYIELARTDPECVGCVATVATTVEPMTGFENFAMDPAPAGQIEVGRASFGYLPAIDDADTGRALRPYFTRTQVALQAGHLYEVVTDAPAGYWSGHGALFDAQGRMVGTTRGETGPLRIVAPRDGLYTLGMGAVGPTWRFVWQGRTVDNYYAGGLFRVLVRDLGTQDDDEPGAIASASTTLEVGRTYPRRIDFDGDVDVFKVSVGAPGRFRLRVDSRPGSSVAASIVDEFSLASELWSSAARSWQTQKFAVYAPAELFIRVWDMPLGERPDNWLASYPYTITVDRLPIADIVGLGGVRGSDGQITSDDLIAFLSAFFTLDVSLADVAQVGGVPLPDGWLTGDDIVAFIQAFVAGE